MDRRTTAQAEKGRRPLGLFAPRSIAVVGASAEPNAVTARPLRFLKAHGFAGDLFAVNPRHQRIGDVACFPSIAALPEAPDVAMLGVSAANLERAVIDCAARGVPLISIYTAAVPDDAKARMRAAASAAGSRILGPNSLGFINAHEHIACTYSQAALLRRIPRGGLTIVSQSGGLGGCLLNRAIDAGVGLSRFLAPGVGLDLDLPELLEMEAASPTTRAVAAIVESVDGLRFVRAVEKLHAAGKRIVVWRIGGSETGRAAAVSHTGAIAGDERVFSSICRDLGALQVASQDELLEVAAACTADKPPAGAAVGIVTSSGGAAIIVADALEPARIKAPPLSRQTERELRKSLPATANVSNPLDLGAGEGLQTFRTGLSAMLADPAFDCTLLALTMVTGDQANRVLPETIRILKASARPAAVVWPAGSLAAAWRHRLRKSGVAVFERAEFAASALRLLRLKPHALSGSPGAVSEKAAQAKSMVGGMTGVQTEWAVRRLLRLYGIESPREALTNSGGEAVAAAREIGFPVALKAQSPLVPHRAAAGALALGVCDPAGVEQAYARIVAALAPHQREALEGVLVQAMVRPEHEIFLGVVRDPAFGSVIACGRGGGDVEREADVQFMFPTTDAGHAADALRRQSFAGPLGAAGIATLADLVVRLSQLIFDLGPALVELDVNPVALIDGGTRALALDALAVIDARSPARRIKSGASALEAAQ